MMDFTVKQLVKDFSLDVVAGEEGLVKIITEPQLSRPGIELAGMFDFYEYNRLQLFGSKEATFFKRLTENQQITRVDKLFRKQPPAFLFSKNAVVSDVIKNAGNEHGICVLKSNERTSALASELWPYLTAKLAQRQSFHATLLNINGIGVLIRGESGIGKSEVALELVRNGHQLVADDRVDLYEREAGTLIGEAPDVLKHYLEIRGIGVVDVVKLFGAQAFKEDQTVMLVVDLVDFDKQIDEDRLGIENRKEKLINTWVPHAKIPITAARSASMLVEVAAMNLRLKLLGTDMAKDFSESLNKAIESNAKKAKKNKGN